MNRNNRKHLGSETVAIVDRGWYETSDGSRIDIAKQVADCLNSTHLYSPVDLEELLVINPTQTKETVFEVRNETTLTAARRLVVDQERDRTLCLNFASAKNPGGGFLGGSQAQEESLARSSALYASLLTQSNYYDENRECHTALYTENMILSTNVPIFRDDNGSLLTVPYLASIVTSPAVNAGAIRKNEPEKLAKIRSVMANRISNVLSVAVRNGCEHLVLGAWGCGVFRNDPIEIAELFAETLLRDERFRNRFIKVTFAVLDGTCDEKIVSPFRDCFAK